MQKGRSRLSRLTRRTLLSGVGAGIVSMPYLNGARAAETLYINTWGGPWEEAARAVLFDPFTQATGVEIRTIAPVSFAKLAAQTRTGVYEFDVTTLGVAELGRANTAKLIDTYDESKIPASSLWPGAVTLNGINSHAFANIIAYRKDRFPNGGPKNWAEFWDTTKFPGARSLQNYPGRVLAFALMADGVEASKLFPYDLDRAFKSLDRIKKDVRVWWSQSPQSQRLLRDGEVELIGMWNTSAHRPHRPSRSATARRPDADRRADVVQHGAFAPIPTARLLARLLPALLLRSELDGPRHQQLPYRAWCDEPRDAFRRAGLLRAGASQLSPAPALPHPRADAAHRAAYRDGARLL